MQKIYSTAESSQTSVEFENPEQRRKGLAPQLLFSEERSSSLMQTTLNHFRASFIAIKPRKLRFDSFNYERESTSEIVVRVIPSMNRFGLIREIMEKKGLLEPLIYRKSTADDALEATFEYRERTEELLDILASCAKKELGPNPGGRRFVRWFLEFISVMEPTGADKHEWFNQRLEFIDELAYDYARFGLTPPTEIQGLPPAFSGRFNATYRAACSQHGKNTKLHNPFIRKWISLRKSALIRGRSFDPEITPDFLMKMAEIEYCPVTGVLLEISSSGLYSDEDSRWSVERQCNEMGYSCSNITLTSSRVNKIRGSLNGFELFERAAGIVADERLTVIQWCRLVNLHKLACSKAEPYLCYENYPVVWCKMYGGGSEAAEEAVTVVGIIAEMKKELKGFPVTESYLLGVAKRDRVFSDWTHEKLNYAVSKFYRIIRQQLKNDHRQALNFSGLFELGDGSHDHQARTFAMKRLLVLLVNEVTGHTETGGEFSTYSLGELKSSLTKGKFSTGGYAS